MAWVVSLVSKLLISEETPIYSRSEHWIYLLYYIMKLKTLQYYWIHYLNYTLSLTTEIKYQWVIIIQNKINQSVVFGRQTLSFMYFIR